MTITAGIIICMRFMRGCLADGTDVLYKKLDVASLSAPVNLADYNCIVASRDQWQLSRCTESRPVVCQSDYLLPGMY